MARQRRTAPDSNAFATVAKGGARDRLKDAGSKDLEVLARKLGNDRVQDLIQQATGKRDALLGFVKERLARVSGAQQAELQSMSKDRVWFDEVARRKGRYALPDPTRWRGPALLYKRAAEALCAGDLGRGAQLIQKAVEAERAAFDAMPEQVRVDEGAGKPERGPDEGAFIESGESCPETRAPEVMQAADGVIRVADRSREQAVPRSARQHRGWWDAEEEEKKDEKDGGKEGGKKGGTPAIEAPVSTGEREKAEPEKAAPEKEAPEKEAPEKEAPEKEEPEKEEVAAPEPERAPERSRRKNAKR